MNKDRIDVSCYSSSVISSNNDHSFNSVFAIKPSHPHNQGACVSENAKDKDPGSNNKIAAHTICAHIGP